MLFSACAKKIRTVYANLFFTLLAHIMPANMYFQLLGQEIRVFNYPVDGVVFLPSGEKIIIQYHGCFWHPCVVNGEFKPCHLPTSKVCSSHAASCLTCQTAAANHGDLLKPSLFKIKPNEGLDSKHPRKQSTFKQMYEATEAITEKLKQSGEFLAVVVVRECEILNFYEQILACL